jgi:hypothetical protein
VRFVVMHFQEIIFSLMMASNAQPTIDSVVKRLPLDRSLTEFVPIE